MDNEDNFSLEEEQVGVIEENYPKVDSKQVEKELTEQLLKQQENQNPEDVASHFFRLYYPVYKNLLGGLSNKDARKVAEHVVQWPLENENPTFTAEAAKQAFQIGIRLIDAKMIMKSVVEIQRTQEMLEARAKQEAEKSTKAEIDAVEQVDKQDDLS